MESQSIEGMERVPFGDLPVFFAQQVGLSVERWNVIKCAI
jgi:hypothetical protein